MKNVDLTKGKVMSVLLALALPIMGSSLLQFTYNLVDMLWIGHMGSDAVASIGSSSFFTSLGYSINALIIIGTGIKVSHSIGKNDPEGVKEYIQAGMILNVIIGVIYAIILIIFGRSFISFLKLNNAGIENDAYLYLVWSAPMLLFAFFNNLFSRIFASLGNTKSALNISAIGIIVNIVLDPILIYIFNLGIVGAAIATLVANVIMFVMYLNIGKAFLTFTIKKNIDFMKMKEIVKLGMPIAFQRVLFTLINIMLAKLIASFGAGAVAAQKIGVQIESVTYMVTGGLNGAVASFIGQNFGAKKYQRIQKGYQAAISVGCVYAALSSVVFWGVPEQLAGLFVKELDTIAITAGYLRIIGYSQVFNAMEMVTNGLLTGIGKPKIPSYVSVIFTALRLPMAYVCVVYLGVEGIWWSITLSTILKGSVLVSIYLLKIKKQLVSNLI
ncbi:MAG: MATE family efflux transporter [Cellulosilyticum sp.]|nr:MATE family efflux transporter [Cellulosilyticum sp.]